MNSKVYNINYSKLTTWFVPGRVRRQRIIAYLRIVISTVTMLYQDFLRFRTAKLYQLMITPQVCYLERLLNDRYDFTLRRIRIVDGEQKPPKYFYHRDEEKPVYLYMRSDDKPVYLYTRGESGLLTDDFVVLVPKAVPFELPEMTSLIKAYKLAGMRFKIQKV